MTADNMNIQALKTLLARSEDKRRWRAISRPMSNFRWTGSEWQGICPSAQEGVQHRCRIVLLGQRSFNCTCKDKAQRGRQVGPCKHVISLAQAAIKQLETFAR